MVDAMSSPTPPLRIAEAAAIEAAHSVAGERILCTTLGRAQAAAALATARPNAAVTCWFLDEHHQRQAAASCGRVPNLALAIDADAPQGEIDLAVVPLATRGESELARDLLQSSWQQLAVGGTLVTAVDNPRDHWVREQLAAWFDKVRIERDKRAIVYLARKDASPRKVKNYRCEFALRDRDRLIKAASRPGVFAHRRADPGARRLLDAAELPPGGRALDLGCGSGVVALALAARDPSVSVHAVDGHARAVQCTREGAELNGLANVTVELNSTGQLGRPAEFDLALLNPPYYGDFAIAQLFLDAARAALKPGGKVHIVTKADQWYRETMPSQWRQFAVREVKGYWVISARRP